MIRKILIATIYSSIAFCVISYLSVLTSLLNSIGKPTKKPIANLGFPFKYYEQFWLEGSNSPNCGWNVSSFIFDYIIIWILVTLLFFKLKEKK